MPAFRTGLSGTLRRTIAGAGRPSWVRRTTHHIELANARRSVRDLPGRHDATAHRLCGAPTAGRAAVKWWCRPANLLRATGLQFRDRESARQLAIKLLEEFESCEYVVAPSAHAPGMIRTHYADLAGESEALARRMAALSAEPMSSRIFSSMSQVRQVPGYRAASPITTPVRACANGCQEAAARTVGEATRVI